MWEQSSALWPMSLDHCCGSAAAVGAATSPALDAAAACGLRQRRRRPGRVWRRQRRQHNERAAAGNGHNEVGGRAAARPSHAAPFCRRFRPAALLQPNGDESEFCKQQQNLSARISSSPGRLWLLIIHVVGCSRWPRLVSTGPTAFCSQQTPSDTCCCGPSLSPLTQSAAAFSQVPHWTWGGTRGEDDHAQYYTSSWGTI